MKRTDTSFLSLIIPAFILFLAACQLPENVLPPEHLWGIGVTWSDWLSTDELPFEYRSNPRAYDQAQLDLIAAAGGTATHGSFDWCNIEPVAGTYDWSRADERVQDCAERGLAVFAYLGNTPDWALPAEWTGGPGSGWRTPPDEAYVDEFTAYCTAVAARYAGRVDHFFFWNEPNGCSWVNDGCSNSDSYALYTRWLKRAYTAVKAGNPDAEVAAASIDYGSHVPLGYQYIEGMYASGARGYFDAVDIHPYAPGGLYWDAVAATRRVLDEHGDGDIPIWISEYGWEDSASLAAPARLRQTLDGLKSGAYGVTYARYLVLSDLPGSTQWGPCDRSLQPRPLYTAFKDYDKGH